VHPIWLSDLLRAENDQVAGLLKQPDKQKLASYVFTPITPAVNRALQQDSSLHVVRSVMGCYGKGGLFLLLHPPSGPQGRYKIVQGRVFDFWTLAPPVWFWFEDVILFRRAFPQATDTELN
jgi:hypothetical protein